MLCIHAVAYCFCIVWFEIKFQIILICIQNWVGKLEKEIENGFLFSLLDIGPDDLLSPPAQLPARPSPLFPARVEAQQDGPVSSARPAFPRGLLCLCSAQQSKPIGRHASRPRSSLLPPANSRAPHIRAFFLHAVSRTDSTASARLRCGHVVRCLAVQTAPAS